jgi:hypothetical protein
VDKCGRSIIINVQKQIFTADRDEEAKKVAKEAANSEGNDSNIPRSTNLKNLST